jgi:hypothetical protein
MSPSHAVMTQLTGTEGAPYRRASRALTPPNVFATVHAVLRLSNIHHGLCHT